MDLIGVHGIGKREILYCFPWSILGLSRVAYAGHWDCSKKNPALIFVFSILRNKSTITCLTLRSCKVSSAVFLQASLEIHSWWNVIDRLTVDRLTFRSYLCWKARSPWALLLRCIARTAGRLWLVRPWMETSLWPCGMYGALDDNPPRPGMLDGHHWWMLPFLGIGDPLQPQGASWGLGDRSKM